MPTAGLYQLAYVTTRAEGLLAFAPQQHAGNVGLGRPGIQLRLEGLDHGQAEGVEVLRGGQGCHTDA